MSIVSQVLLLSSEMATNISENEKRVLVDELRWCPQVRLDYIGVILPCAILMNCLKVQIRFNGCYFTVSVLPHTKALVLHGVSADFLGGKKQR